jgi:hypothetical protein
MVYDMTASFTHIISISVLIPCSTSEYFVYQIPRYQPKWPSSSMAQGAESWRMKWSRMPCKACGQRAQCEEHPCMELAWNDDGILGELVTQKILEKSVIYEFKAGSCTFFCILTWGLLWLTATSSPKKMGRQPHWPASRTACDCDFHLKWVNTSLKKIGWWVRRQSQIEEKITSTKL